jgi:hypothetical protein
LVARGSIGSHGRRFRTRGAPPRRR